MTSKAFSIYFLLKEKSGLVNLWKLKKIKQEKKDFWLGNSSKFKYYHFLRKYTFPKFIFRNHMSHENEAILRKSISDEKRWQETLEKIEVLGNDNEYWY